MLEIRDNVVCTDTQQGNTFLKSSCRPWKVSKAMSTYTDDGDKSRQKRSLVISSDTIERVKQDYVWEDMEYRENST